MPGWKWAPDNATIKLATGRVTLTVSGVASPELIAVAALGTLVICGVGETSSYPISWLSNPIVTVELLITGPGGYGNLIAPISSYQVYLDSDGKISIQAVVPDFSLAGDIADRADGDMIIRRKRVIRNNIRVYDVLAQAAISQIRIDEGAKNKSITLQAAA